MLTIYVGMLFPRQRSHGHKHSFGINVAMIEKALLPLDVRPFLIRQRSSWQYGGGVSNGMKSLVYGVPQSDKL